MAHLQIKRNPNSECSILLKKLIITQAGNSQILLMLLLLLSTSLYLAGVAFLKQDYSRNNQELNLFLCHKAMNKATFDYIERMNKFNRKIQVTNILILASVAIPPKHLLFKRVKKGLQLIQNTFYFSYMNKLRSYYVKGCRYNKEIVKDPYKKRRSLAGLKVIRKIRWKNYTSMKAGKLIVTNHLQAEKLYQKTKKAFQFLKLFSL